MRRMAPQAALAVAEHFRDAGENVLLIVDSVTRYAHAARDVALAGGRAGGGARLCPPASFPPCPSCWSGRGRAREGRGSITGIFSVLVDGDRP